MERHLRGGRASARWVRPFDSALGPRGKIPLWAGLGIARFIFGNWSSRPPRWMCNMHLDHHSRCKGQAFVYIANSCRWSGSETSEVRLGSAQ